MTEYDAGLVFRPGLEIAALGHIRRQSWHGLCRHLNVAAAFEVSETRSGVSADRTQY